MKIQDLTICWPSPDHFRWCLPVNVQSSEPWITTRASNVLSYKSGY